MSNNTRLSYSDELSKKPVTRYELWRAMAMLRTTISDVHIYSLASQVGDQREKEEASAEIKKSLDVMDKFMDDLLDITEVPIDGD